MDKPSRIDFKVDEMICSGCATDMETVLNNTDGIVKASVDYPSGQVGIEFDPVELSAEKINSMMKEMGFRAKAV